MNIIKIMLVLLFCPAFWPFIYGQTCGDFFDFKLDRCALYTPCEVTLSIEMTNQWIINEPYMFKISVFLYNSLLKEYQLNPDPAVTTRTTLTFPQVMRKSRVRCRVELLQQDHFWEAKEKVLTLYPARQNIEPVDLENISIWVYDQTGQMQTLLKQFAIPCSDASYQPVRDFTTPDIFIVGQNSDPNKIQSFFSGLNACDSPLVILIMKQTQYPNINRIEIADCPSRFKDITIHQQSDFFSELDIYDLLSILRQNNSCLCIPDSAFAGSHKSLLACRTDCTDFSNSILGYITDSNRTIIYCQLSIEDSNPPAVLLFKNILACSAEIIKKGNFEY